MSSRGIGRGRAAPRQQTRAEGQDEGNGRSPGSGSSTRSRGFDQRGSGGGSGRSDWGGRGGSSSSPIVWTKERPPAIFESEFPLLKAKFPSGWKTLEDDLTSRYVYKGPQACSFKEKIKLKTNHFPLSKFNFPTRIFHYEVNFERIREPREGGGLPKRRSLSNSPLTGKRRSGGSDGGRGNNDSGQQLQKRRMPKPLPQLILQYLVNKIYKEKKFFGLVTDLSNNIYSTTPLEDIGVSLVQTVCLTDVDQEILQENDEGKVQVTIIKSDQDVDPKMLQALNQHLSLYGTWKGFEMDPSLKTVVEQVMNAVAKSFPTYKFLPLGRSNLVRWPESTFPLGQNVVCWKGVSAHFTLGWKPYFNVDLAHCAFLEDKKVLDAIQSSLRMDPSKLKNWRPWAFIEAKTLLQNVKVHYSPTPGKKLGGPITDILNTSNGKTFFDFNGEQISVKEYYKRKYNKDVDPDGPCLLLRNRCQVPAELCTIKKGQSYNRRLNELQTRELLKIAKKEPHVLHREISQAVNQLSLSNPVAQQWGLGIQGTMLHLPEARVLNPPRLVYGTGVGENEGKGFATITPGDGSWDINNSSFNFYASKTEIRQWGLLAAGDCSIISERNLNDFARSLVRYGKSKGVTFQKQMPIIKISSHLQDRKDDEHVARRNVEALKKIFEEYRAEMCEIVFVIIPKKNSVLYCHVKQASELHVGILTQCVVAQTVQKSQPASIYNILFKVNSKMNGTNYIIKPPEPTAEYYLDITTCPMLIIGADVTHPPPGSTRRIRVGNKEKEVTMPSFAAITGSIDWTGMPYMMDIRAQVKAGKGAAEVIQNLDETVYKMLLEFERKTRSTNTPNGIRPRKIIYYRDGVGDGQFPEVLHVELTAIRKACSKLLDYDGSPYQPKVTFVTVQKRHKTRFFHDSRKGITNAPAGTVVDQEIVDQCQLDYYLLSHKGMMGTSRPTRYRVLWDDSDFSADKIQNLTYFLCYMYVRCCKSVKIPAPTYYAHWAAARAKALTEGLEEYYDDIQKLNKMIIRHPNITSQFPMHFI